MSHTVALLNDSIYELAMPLVDRYLSTGCGDCGKLFNKPEDVAMWDIDFTPYCKECH